MKNTARVLRENNSDILAAWEKEVTSEVPAARMATTVSLYDHLPNIINDIADIMDRYIDMGSLLVDAGYNGILENSQNHGRHRAKTANYTVEQVILEYIIFHRCLSNYLKLKQGYNEEVSDLLKYVIETSILKSVGSFSRSIQEMQEMLVGTIAHDIRNPLAAAQLSLEMIKQDKEGKWVGKMRDAAERSVRKAISLVEGLMNGITVQAGQGMMLNFEEKNLIHDIKWVFEEAKEVYGSEIKLSCPDEVIIGVFDGAAVRRLLENLIGNAIKYGSNLHPITITVKDLRDRMSIEIHNYGNPISKEKQEHIFEFLGRENIDDGTINSWGMGLTLAQIVAEAHGGSVDLKSDEESGTTFTTILLKKFNSPGKRRTLLASETEDH
ncbi:sensor histidine kinase [Nonlabens antarcticus]|uniref:sensor histidine kinase n=1 Tax=Nonlabens antarcticus TaxID=392714 RepID=UPI0018914580|nr:HAMP domain-containing sensor histidine kinase [Nonlabens antarcticus]